jgi:hypothetical protein
MRRRVGKDDEGPRPRTGGQLVGDCDLAGKGVHLDAIVELVVQPALGREVGGCEREDIRVSRVRSVRAVKKTRCRGTLDPQQLVQSRG